MFHGMLARAHYALLLLRAVNPITTSEMFVWILIAAVCKFHYSLMNGSKNTPHLGWHSGAQFHYPKIDVGRPAMVIHLRLRSSIVAVPPVHHHGFITIPAGSIIESSDDLIEPGLHRVRFDGNDLLVFTRDIRERTERVKIGDSVPSS